MKLPWGLICPLFYRHLEIDETTALRQNKGNYNAHMRLSQESVSEIKWWYDSIPTAHYPILLPNSKVDVIIYTDASALSSVLKPVNGITFGAQESVKRFLKGVYEARPSNPRYAVTWEVNKVLNYLKSTSTTECSLKDLTLKLVTLMSLLSAQRGQTIHYLSLEDMVTSETSVTFAVSKPLKQSKPGSKPTVVEFVAYPDNLNICVVTSLKAYLDRTSALRGGAQQLFVSYSKPFKPVSRDTISRWVKIVMQKSGIDVNLFKPHSTRAAATSKAFLKSVPLEHILSVAGWSSSDTFAKFHKKPVINTDSFSTVLLQD